MKAAQPTARAGKALANAPRTDGLTPLDRDRASSIADEGGKSAATVEGQRRPTPTSVPVEGDGTAPEAWRAGDRVTPAPRRRRARRKS